MADYPPRGTPTWDDDLKAYLDTREVALTEQIIEEQTATIASEVAAYSGGGPALALATARFKSAQVDRTATVVPGVTVGAWATGATALAVETRFVLDPFGSPTVNPVLRFFGAPDVIVRGPNHPQVQTIKPTGFTFPGDAAELMVTTEVEMKGLTSLDLRNFSQGVGGTVWLSLDGRYLTAAPVASAQQNDGAERRLPISGIPGDDGDWHLLSIETSGYTNWPVALHSNAGSEVRFPTLPVGLVEAWVWDSYGEGINDVPGDLQGKMRNLLGIVPEQARLLGTRDVRNYSIGARGWVNTNGGTRPTIVQTITTDLIPDTDVKSAVFGISSNDAGLDVEPAYRAGLTALKTSRPDIATTVVSNIVPIDAGGTLLRDKARLVCAELGIPFIDMTGYLSSLSDPHFAGEGHLTAVGYKDAATVVAAARQTGFSLLGRASS